MTANMKSADLQQALEVVLAETFSHQKEAFRQARGNREAGAADAADANPPATETEAGYAAKLTYDGGDYIADWNVDLFDAHGRPVGGISTTGLSMGAGKYTVEGRVLLNYRIEDIRTWRCSGSVNSSPTGVTITWLGMLVEHIGTGFFTRIPPQGLTTSLGRIS
jgi:hypothetical protein